MLGMSRYTVFSAILLSLTFTDVGHFQPTEGQNTLPIKGALQKDGDVFKKGKVLLYERNEVIAKAEPNWRGKFSFELPLNAHYTVEVRAKKHITKRVSFNTMITEDVEDPNPSRFDFDVIMLQKRRLADKRKGIFDFPVGRVFFDPYKKEFRFNDSYTSKIRREFRKALDADMQSLDSSSSDSLIMK